MAFCSSKHIVSTPNKNTVLGGIGEDHNHVSRKAIDRLIESYINLPAEAEEFSPTWK